MVIKRTKLLDPEVYGSVFAYKVSLHQIYQAVTVFIQLGGQ
jgi:hypothetical protein